MPNLTKDLASVAGIIGALGCNIADAQKRFDLNYLEDIERLLDIAKSLATKDTTAAEGLAGAIRSVLLTLAPSRYQFTETTLAVRLNLAQSLDVTAGGGVSAGFGAVAVNAALTVGYSFNYEAAAECKTVIHAIPPDSATFTALLDRAKAITGTAAPARSEVDQEIMKRFDSIYAKLPALPAPTAAQKPGAADASAAGKPAKPTGGTE